MCVYSMTNVSRGKPASRSKRSSIELSFFGTVVHIYAEDSAMFRGMDIAKALGYADTNQAVRKHVDEEDKVTRRFDGRLYTYINECGVYSLIFSSKKPIAKDFKRWVFHDVLPSIRKTGGYGSAAVHNQLSIMNETDLHYELVREIRKRFPNLVMVVQGGELQDTSAKRIKMWKKGFTGGQPDVMIMNPHVKYNGLCIELKTPKGTGSLSPKQSVVLARYRQMGWEVIVSDDLVSVLFSLSEYAEGVREICHLCGRGFKSEATIERHNVGFHRASLTSLDELASLSA